jgi:hypothetical protein
MRTVSVGSGFVIFVAVTSALAPVTIVVSVMSASVLVPALSPVASIIPPGCLKKHPFPCRIVHHSLVRRLLLFLDCQHRITRDFGCNIPACVRVRVERHKSFFASILLHSIRLRPLYQTIELPFSQQISFHFLAYAATSTRSTSAGSIVHPVNAISPLLATGSFL